MGRKKLSLEERFWKRVEKLPSGCWEWSGARTWSNYGLISGYGSPGGMKAHRASWIVHNGPIPEGMFVCHKCDNPPCCNPDHLFLGTPKENTHDAIQKGRMCKPEKMRVTALKYNIRGEKHCCAKLTDLDALVIKNCATKRGVRTKDLAEWFRISESTICDIKAGRTWKHVGVANGI